MDTSCEKRKEKQGKRKRRKKRLGTLCPFSGWEDRRSRSRKKKAHPVGRDRTPD
jgi:hypothetical protein